MMKLLLTAVFFPLFLSQGIAIAQPSSETPVSEENSVDALPVEPLIPGETPINEENSVDSPSVDAETESTPLSIIPLKGTEQIQLQLVHCTQGPDCWLANRFLPASSRLNQLELKFDNPAQKPATILNSAIDIQGSLTNYPLPTNVLSIPNEELSLPAKTITTVPLKLDRSAMPPEQYVGLIHLTQAGQSNRLTLPINLSVRVGPLIPIVILMLGVVLGRLLKYMREQGTPQVELRKKVYQLENDIREAHPGDLKILRLMVQAVLRMVYRQKLEAADTEIALIQSRQDMLMLLRTFEDNLSEPIQGETIKQIQRTRDLIEQKLDDDARETLDKILETANAQGRGAAEVREAVVQELTETLEENSRGLAIGNTITNAVRTWPKQFQNFLVVLAGVSDQVRAEATYWFVRPLVYMVLIVGLTLVGLNTLYIEKGENFGARPMSDYLTLFLWGLSADVASRSVSSLRGQEE